MMETVRTIALPEPTPEVSFTVSPVADQYTYTVGLTVYSPSNADVVNINADTTFVADARFPSPTRWATSYEWDFGDGAKGYGSTTTHSYLYTSPAASVQPVLTVIDNRGARWRARKELYLIDVPLVPAGLLYPSLTLHPKA